MILFGAEQFSSSVEKEIVENSSTFLFGRTESNELRTPTYSGFSDEVKTKLTMLPQGQLLAKFAKCPQPIFVKFPFPPCLPGDQFKVPEEAWASGLGRTRPARLGQARLSQQDPSATT